MSGFKIVSISRDAGTMVIDWGAVTLNHFIPADLLGADALTAEEVAERIEAMRPPAPEPVNIPPALAAMVQPVPVVPPDVAERAWRDAAMTPLLESRDRHRDELELRIETTLSDGQFVELLAYIQKLRDWPQSEGFPDQSLRPTPPAWLTI